jgi:hypothetical protein
MFSRHSSLERNSIEETFQDNSTILMNSSALSASSTHAALECKLDKVHKAGMVMGTVHREHVVAE